MSLIYYAPIDDLVTVEDLNQTIQDIDLTNQGPFALNVYQAYPVVEDTAFYPGDFYSISSSYTLVAQADTSISAEQSSVATAVDIELAKTKGAEYLSKQFSVRSSRLLEVSNTNPKALALTSSIDEATRVSGINYWVSRFSSLISESRLALETVFTSTVDQIADRVAPAKGVLSIGLDENNPLDCFAAVLSGFESKSYTESDLELYFPGTDTTVAYNGTQFPFTANAVTDSDPTVQIRIQSNSVVVDEFALRPAAAVYDVDFGFEAINASTETADDAVVSMVQPANGEFSDSVVVDGNACLRNDSNIVKLENLLRGTSINIGNNIEVRPASAGGRLEVSGDLILDGSDLTEAADDTAAAAAGVVVGQVYHNAGALRVRIS